MKTQDYLEDFEMKELDISFMHCRQTRDIPFRIALSLTGFDPGTSKCRLDISLSQLAVLCLYRA
jgi:hypothetical protein